MMTGGAYLPQQRSCPGALVICVIDVTINVRKWTWNSRAWDVDRLLVLLGL